MLEVLEASRVSGRQVGRQVRVDRALDVHRFGDGLNDEGGTADIGHVRGEFQAGRYRLGLLGGDQAVLGHQFEVADDFAARGVEGGGIGVEDGYLVAGQGEHLGDAVPHEPGAKYADWGAWFSDLRDSLAAMQSRHARRGVAGRQFRPAPAWGFYVEAAGR